MNIANKKWLLNLARQAIETELRKEKLIIKKVPAEFKKKKACFVTLTQDGKLRGCIGHLIPVQALYRDVIENARAAAFMDYRFDSVTDNELPQIKIEISILDQPKKYRYSCPKNLLKFLSENKPGVILKKGINRATYLPQVWKELKNPEKFMNSLSQKANLPFDEWKKMTSVDIYSVSTITTAT